YLEGGGYLVSWCVGHLVELSAPERYDERFAKWRLEDLPILPERWLYEVSQATRKQYQILKSLMERPDVTSLVCATDAGREGELIFRLVYNQARCKKPFERLWISSMEDAAIREGFEKLKPGTSYDALYKAALCRERADWIVGMNATRLFSCLYGQTLAVGRVMTPTLAMVVMRDAQIAVFKPEPFWTVQLKAGDLNVSSRRFSTKNDAEAVLQECQAAGEVMIEAVETKEKLEKPPLLYDLTSLQRDANRILGFTAQQTLDHAQSLYEKKLVTYPRTDSRYLTDDMREMLPELINAVARKFKYSGSALRSEPVRLASIFNSSKVSDHHAIIPTKTMTGSDFSELSLGEMAVLQLISTRLLCAVAEDYRYAESTVKSRCGAEEFTRKGRTDLQLGWKAIWQYFYPDKKKDEDSIGQIPGQGKRLQIDSSALKEGKTSPSKHRDAGHEDRKPGPAARADPTGGAEGQAQGQHRVQDVRVADGAQIDAGVAQPAVVIVQVPGEQAQRVQAQNLEQPHQAAKPRPHSQRRHMAGLRHREAGDAQEAEDTGRQRHGPVVAPFGQKAHRPPGGAEPGERDGQQKAQRRPLGRRGSAEAGALPPLQRRQRRQPEAGHAHEKQEFGKGDVGIALKAGKQWKYPQQCDKIQVGGSFLPRLLLSEQRQTVFHMEKDSTFRASCKE
ncbi:MAG: hypothetical protein K5990_03660, partial [Oscillospiraceae bacterium]|nr:hypothetical protein [Oscillospiraceae bacterium]